MYSLAILRRQIRGPASFLRQEADDPSSSRRLYDRSLYYHSLYFASLSLCHCHRHACHDMLCICKDMALTIAMRRWRHVPLAQVEACPPIYESVAISLAKPCTPCGSLALLGNA